MNLRNRSNYDKRSAAGWLAGAAVFAWLSQALAPAAAIQTPTPPPIDPQLARGETLYRIHCASCHGSQGKGDGPVAASLKVRPADLTSLTPPNDGKFPEAEVTAAVDGRTKVPAHGARDMPVWGLSFADRGRDADQEREVAAEIRALVSYLRSLQRR